MRARRRAGRRAASHTVATTTHTPQPTSIQVTQTGTCQGNRYEGSYARLLGETLRSYELELR